MNEQWKRYAELELREREFEIALKSIQQEKAVLEPELLGSMARKGSTVSPFPASHSSPSGASSPGRERDSPSRMWPVRSSNPASASTSRKTTTPTRCRRMCAASPPRMTRTWLLRTLSPACRNRCGPSVPWARSGKSEPARGSPIVVYTSIGNL